MCFLRLSGKLKSSFLKISVKISDDGCVSMPTHLLHAELNSFWLIPQKNIHEDGTHRRVQAGQLEKSSV